MKQLGMEIRRLRRDRGYTLNDVASRTGLSASMLSMLERGLAGPSIGTLVAVSSALGVQMAELFHAEKQVAGPVLRHGDQMVVQTGPGITRRIVSSDDANGIEVSVLELEPGSDTGVKPVRHSGQEYALVLEGAFVVTLGEDVYELEEGDGMTFDARQPHAFANASSRPVRIVLVALNRSAG